MQFIASPGTYIAEEIKESNQLILDSKQTRIIRAKVIAVGENEITEFGISIPVPVSIGQTAYFLSYEGDYDNIKRDGKRYYTVLRKDHRFILDE